MRVFPHQPRAAFLPLLALALLLSFGCARQSPTERTLSLTSMQSIRSTPAVTLLDGREVTRYSLTNVNGIGVEILDLGGIVTKVSVPDGRGRFANITLGFDDEDLARYADSGPYFGAIVGRFGNRIAGGRFELDGETHTLVANDPPNHLHGGNVGYDKRIWSAEPLDTDDGPALRLTLDSEDGEEGYPGALSIVVQYTLTNGDELRIDYAVKNVGRRATVANLTQHSYWNLQGADSGTTVLDHILELECDQYVPVDDTGIPTGEILPVAGTPFDFTEPTPIGERIDEVPGGYDHTIVAREFETEGKRTVRRIARLVDPDSGRVLTILTNQPGVQLYSGNFLAGEPEHGGFPKHAGVCLEAQHLPDSPNQPSFPSVRIDPGETIRRTTIHAFTTVPPTLER